METVNMNMRDVLISLLLAVIVGVIVYYPNHLAETHVKNDKNLSSQYVYSALSVIPIGISGDEILYGAPVKKVMDGTWKLNDSYAFEGTLRPNPTPNLAFIISGLMARLLGSINRLFEISDFIWPFVSVLVGYFFLMTFAGNRLVSVWGVVLLMCSKGIPQLINNILFKFPSITAAMVPADHALSLTLEKLPYNQMLFPFTFAAYFVFFIFLKKSNWVNCVLAGVVVGLSSYFYFFSFMLLGLQIVFFVVVAWLRGEKRNATYFFMSGCLALIVSFYYLVGVALHMTNPDGVLFSITAGVTRTLTDAVLLKEMIKTTVFSGAILFLLYKKLIQWAHAALILSISASAYFLTLLSVLIAFLPEVSHVILVEVRYANLLTLILLIAVILRIIHTKISPWGLLNHILNTKKYLPPCMGFVLAVFLLCNTIQVLANTSYFYNRRANLYYNRYVVHKDTWAAYEWLNKNAPKDSVVLSADIEQITMIPLQTGLYTYIPVAFLSTLHIDEIWKRIREGFSFLGISQEVLNTFVLYDDEGYGPALDLLDRITAVDSLQTFKEVCLKVRKARFHRTIFMVHYAFEKGSLSFRYYKDKMTPEEKGRVMKGDNSFVFFVPDQLYQGYFKDYKVSAGDAKILTDKVDFVWFGEMERALTGQDALVSQDLKLVFDSDVVKLYKIDR
ncbi:MAG: hypothetical protein HQM16_17105 [Deltaproteobacteria bacterium]|nr:hypothetical protein [Deltaproteobacteria bacterium]